MNDALRSVTRILGMAPPYRLVAVPVTPKEDMLDTFVPHASSARDALTTYCDRHAWRVAEVAHLESDPPRMVAEIYAGDDAAERLHILVEAVTVERKEIQRVGDTYVGSYRIIVGRSL